MSSRNSRSLHVRTKVVALLVSLVALWSFAAFVTVREGLNLLWVSTLDEGIAQPNESLLPALQDERRLTLIYIGSGEAGARRAMLSQREKTDDAAANFVAKATANSVQLAASPTLEQRLTQTFEHLDSLEEERRRIDARTATRPAVATSFATITDSIFGLYDAMATVDDDDIAHDARTLISVTRAREILAREDALLAGALAAENLTAPEYQEFVQLVGAQRFLFREARANLRDEDRASFDELFASRTFTQVTGLENIMMARTAAQPLPISAAEWDAAMRPAAAQVHQAVLDSGDRVVQRAVPVGIGVVVRLALAGVLGLIAVIASVIISITTARALVAQLERLRNTARDLASYRLPRVVDRLQHGEKVDIKVEAPPLDFGDDEIGQVGHAFNAVQETAIRVAVEQAELRRSVRDVFLSLARRSQALLHRQLALLDTMERRATEAEELAELFRIDHLATRMRRNAENLIVLSGATAGRAWRRPVPIVDVLRGALAEVEDYTRVTVLPVGPSALVGRAVGDVIHLLAELIENAVSFSPPETVVRVGGSVVGSGFAIEIEDRGLGMSEAERAAANAQLANPPEFKLSSTARLGLYVVGKLAERHGVRVRLTESAYGGTTAIVLLPASIMADVKTDSLDGESIEGPRSAQPANMTGRHRSAAAADATNAGSAFDVAEVAGSGTNSTPVLFDDPADVPTLGTGLATPARQPTVRYSPAATRPTTLTQHPTTVQPGPAQQPASGLPTRAPQPPQLTPAGLPVRQRPVAPTQTTDSRLDNATTVTAVQSTSDTASRAGNATPPRGIEDMRNLMSSYRSGTLRGRTDAARLLDGDHTSGSTVAQDPSPTNEEG